MSGLGVVARVGEFDALQLGEVGAVTNVGEAVVGAA